MADNGVLFDFSSIEMRRCIYIERGGGGCELARNIRDREILPGTEVLIPTTDRDLNCLAVDKKWEGCPAYVSKSSHERG